MLIEKIIGGESARSFADEVKINCNLTKLDLHGVCVCVCVCALLFFTMCEFKCPLSHEPINLRFNVIFLVGNNIGSEGAYWIAEALKTNQALTTLNLGGKLLSKVPEGT